MSKLQEKYLQNQVPFSPQARLELARVQALFFLRSTNCCKDAFHVHIPPGGSIPVHAYPAVVRDKTKFPGGLVGGVEILCEQHVHVYG